jgi:hypothetical protein
VSFASVRVNQLPAWLGGPEARAYQGASGKLLDDLLARQKASVQLGNARLGSIDPADDAGLWAAGEERRILRAPGEDGAAYLERLSRAHSIWYWGGTLPGLTQVFEPFFADHDYVPAYTETRRLDPDRDTMLIALQTARGRANPLYWHAEHPPSCEWITVLHNNQVGGAWDGNYDWFSRVFILLTSPWTDPPLWDADAQWGAGVWGDGGLWGTNITEQEAAYMRAMVRRLKSPSAYPVLAAISLPGGDMWGAPGLWGDGDVWNSLEAVAYLTIGHVWGEEAWLGEGLVDLWGDSGTWGAYEGDPLQR